MPFGVVGEHAVATGGTALTAHHIHALRPGASVLTLAFDGDQAGLQAALRVAELPGSVTSGLSIRVAHLPEASDPGDLLSAGRWDLVQDALDRSVPLAQHQIDQVVAKYNLNEPEALVRAIYAAQGVIARIESPLDRTQAVSHLAKRVGRSTDLVQLALQASSNARGGRWADRERGRALT